MQWRPGGFASDQRGGVAIIGAALILLLVVLSALAIDLGSMTLKAREVQGAADLAALSAARNLPRAQQAAQATAYANLGREVQVQARTGVYVGDRAIAPADRFTAGAPSPNAAQVTLVDEAPLYFAAIFGNPSATITRTATAALPGSQASAVFSLGTRLLSLEGGVLNALLGGLLGSNINLSVMDYNKLIGADVNLLEFLDALAVELDLDVGDYDALLAHDIDTGIVLKVLEVVGSSDTRSILSRLTGAGLGAKLKVGDLVGADVDARDGLRRALNLDVSALDLIMASLKTANDDRQLALDTNINALVADVVLKVAIGEKPNSAWVTVTSGGEPVIRTAQTRLFAKVKTKSVLDALVGLDIQVFAEVASAEAFVDRIICTAPRGVNVKAKPGLLQLVVGKVDNPAALDDFKTEIRTSKLTAASILGIPTLRIYANVEADDTTHQTLRFNESDIEARRYKTVRSREIGSSLLGNLLDTLKLDIIGIPVGDLLGRLLSPLGTLLGWLLDIILNPLLSLLGIGLGEADVRVLNITCPGDVGGIPSLVG